MDEFDFIKFMVENGLGDLNLASLAEAPTPRFDREPSADAGETADPEPLVEFLCTLLQQGRYLQDAPEKYVYLAGYYDCLASLSYLLTQASYDGRGALVHLHRFWMTKLREWAADSQTQGYGSRPWVGGYGLITDGLTDVYDLHPPNNFEDIDEMLL